jgi:hypothetical protein
MGRWRGDISNRVWGNSGKRSENSLKEIWEKL